MDLPKRKLPNLIIGGVITGFSAAHNAADAVFGGKDLSAFDIAKQAMEEAPINFFAATPLSQSKKNAALAQYRVQLLRRFGTERNPVLETPVV